MKRLKGYRKGEDVPVRIYSKSSKNKIIYKKVFKSPTKAIKFADKYYLSGHGVKIGTKR